MPVEGQDAVLKPSTDSPFHRFSWTDHAVNETIRATGVETDNCFISPGALGHNKSFVRTDKTGKPVVAWTGSANWTPTGLFSTVAARSAEPNLYVRGVVSELPHGRGDESALDVSLIAGGQHTPFRLDIIQPEGVQHPFAHFAVEVTHKQFVGNIRNAIIHSKLVVIDPFSADPVVITGSHNFSASTSDENDETFIIICGARALAEANAVNALAAYAHYQLAGVPGADAQAVQRAEGQ
jgi:phosphatidylserine/phosphatidylglycerophosphate/cardiolipin synthase-like enzyme